MKKCLNCQKDITHKRKKIKFCSLSCSTQFNRLKILHDNLPENNKRCGKCGCVKPFEEFRKNKNSAYGFSYYCKNCDKARIWHSDKRKILINAAKKRSKECGVEFNISVDDISFPTHCPILGLKLAFNKVVCKDNSYSIDRIDPKKGYIKGNVQVISHKANTIKNNATIEELKTIVHYLESIKQKD